MSIRLKNGELKTPAIKALVKAHNKAMNWDIKGLKRKELIEFIVKKGYKINHEKNQLDLTGSAMKRRPAKIVPIKKTTAELKQEMEKKTKAKATRERKKKQKQAVAKVGVPPLPTKDTLKKVQTKKKMRDELKKGTVKTKSVSMGTQTGQTKTTIGTRPKTAGRVDTSASAKGKVMKPAKKTKLKGKLKAAQLKQTDQLEKDFPESYAFDINDRNNRMKFYVPILKEYRKIKQSGTPEQKKQAKKIFEEAVGYNGTEASRFNRFTQSLKSIMKVKPILVDQDLKDDAKKKSAPKPAPKKAKKKTIIAKVFKATAPNNSSIETKSKMINLNTLLGKKVMNNMKGEGENLLNRSITTAKEILEEGKDSEDDPEWRKTLTKMKEFQKNIEKINKEDLPYIMYALKIFKLELDESIIPGLNGKEKASAKSKSNTLKNVITKLDKKGIKPSFQL
tara:strand:+ start:577 stop:1923 length:1347 start_codon:yes stop_codon:yes gene_type:complete